MKRPACVMARMLAGAAIVGAAASPAAAQKGDYSALVSKGFEAAVNDRHDEAIASFHDALLVKPDGREAAMDLGLSLARSGNHAEAIGRFDGLARRIQDDPALKARAVYNRGRSQAELAKAALEKEDRDAALENALAAIASFDEALGADATLEDAKWNREQARHLLDRIAKLQPPPPDDRQQQGDEEQQKEDEKKQDDEGKEQSKSQDENKSDEGQDRREQQDQSQQDESEQQQQQDRSGDGEKSEEQQNQDRQGEDGEQQEGDKEPGESDRQGDPKDSQGDPSEGDGQQGQASAGRPGEGEAKDGMSAREAENLLQLLDDAEMLPVVVRMSSDVELEKTW